MTNAELASESTVVISVSVESGHEGDYQTWQARMNAEAAGFSGYVAAEIVPPTVGVQDLWTVIYRFESPGELADWLGSDVRKRLLGEEVAHNFRDVREYAMSGGTGVDPGYTLVIAHKVRSGCESEFIELQNEFEVEEAGVDGFRGSQLLRPVPGVTEEWTALARFDSKDAVQAWLASSRREQLVKRLEPLVESYETDVVGSSFGSWFSFSMVDGKATPNWKQWMTVLLALYPTVMLLGFATNYAPGGARSSLLPKDWFFVNMAIGNFLSTLALTFLVMPAVTWLLRRWLLPGVSLKISLYGTALVCLAFALSVLIFGIACPGGCV